MSILAKAGEEVFPTAQDTEAFRSLAAEAVWERCSDACESSWAGRPGSRIVTGTLRAGFMGHKGIVVSVSLADDGFIAMQVTDWSQAGGPTVLLRYRDGQPSLMAKDEPCERAWNRAVEGLGIG